MNDRLRLIPLASLITLGTGTSPPPASTDRRARMRDLGTAQQPAAKEVRQKSFDVIGRPVGCLCRSPGGGTSPRHVMALIRGVGAGSLRSPWYLPETGRSGL